MCCLQQFVEYNLMSWQQVGTLGVLMGCFWLATLIMHLVPILEDLFVDKRWPVGTLSPLLFNLLIYTPPRMYKYFRKFLLFGLILSLQWSSNLVVSPCTQWFALLFIPHTNTILSFLLLSPQTHNFILYFPFPGRKIYYI